MKKRLRVHVASTAVEVAGCSAATLRQWRNQNGLLPETRIDGKWTRFSAPEIAVVRVVQMLTELGLTAQAAVDAAMKMQPRLDKIFSTDGMEQISTLVANVLALVRTNEKRPDLAIVSFVDGRQSIGNVLKASKALACVVVDVEQVYSHVVETLYRTDRETSHIVGRVETDRLITLAFADAIDPDKNPPSWERSREEEST